MPIQVVLKFTKGGLKHREYSYHQSESVTIGRQDDCSIVIPETDSSVSRCHCTLDINPPDVTVRDMGSTNGTFLNGLLIGRRKKSDETEELDIQPPTEFAMKPGDRLGLGKNCEIVLNLITQCAECFSEISLTEHVNANHEPICYDCYEDEYFDLYSKNETKNIKR
jgi:hypothetical protein